MAGITKIGKIAKLRAVGETAVTMQEARKNLRAAEAAKKVDQFAGMRETVVTNPAPLDMFDAPGELSRLNTMVYKSRGVVVQMPIETFLKMAKPGEDPVKKARVEEMLSKGERFKNIPALEIDKVDGGVRAKRNEWMVVDHEGRHRARALLARGYTHMPVEIRTHGRGTIRWTEQTDSTKFDYRKDWPTALLGEDRKTAIPFPLTREGKYMEQAPVEAQ